MIARMKAGLKKLINKLTYGRIVCVKIFTGHELRHQGAFADLLSAQH